MTGQERDVKALREVVAGHFVMWRNLNDLAGPSGEWFCECGLQFGFSDNAIDHQTSAVLASDWLAERDARIKAEALAPFLALAESWECEPPGQHPMQYLHREVCPACSRADEIRDRIGGDQ